jgi:hypothetical protein
MHEKERWPLISATGQLSDNLLFANSYEPAWGINQPISASNSLGFAGPDLRTVVKTS